MVVQNFENLKSGAKCCTSLGELIATKNLQKFYFFNFFFINKNIIKISKFQFLHKNLEKIVEILKMKNNVKTLKF